MITVTNPQNSAGEEKMTQPNLHTLFVTAEVEWSLSLYRHLSQNGFAPLTIAPTGKSAFEFFQQTPPRLLLIDEQLADYDVLDLCTDVLAAHPMVKIIVVTAGDTAPPLSALQVGIAGCIPRDLPLAAWPGLLLYILNGGTAFNYNMMRSMLNEVRTAQKRHPLVTIGSLRIDLGRRVVLCAGRQVHLTPLEFALLACLTRNTDHVVTFDQCLNEVWGYKSDDGTPAQVRLYVARLRRKLIDAGQTPDLILTERGVGYRLHSGALHRTPAVSSQLVAHSYASH
jgi:two-component system, OmpR family, KDP operon response regulator KdpE